jgi:4'-phosphopantetheinyl transferase
MPDVMSAPSGMIEPSDAHVWSVAPEVALGESASGLADLSPEERTRMASFRFERDRSAYAAAHVLAREALTWCAPVVSPASWDLSQRLHERPEVVDPPLRPQLRFNISHTHGLVACLVTSAIDCGVDVEVRRDVDDMESLAARVLSPAERGHLMDSPVDHRSDLFFRYWTLKEAYVKARGRGLSLPLEAISFDFRAADIMVRLGPSLEDDGQEWQFEQWAPTGQHILAVAIRSGAARNHRVVRHTGVPTKGVRHE